MEESSNKIDAIKKRLYWILPVISLSVLGGFFLSVFYFSKVPQFLEPSRSVYGQETSQYDSEIFRNFEDFQSVFRTVSEDVLPSIVQINVVTVRTQENAPSENWPFDFFRGDTEPPQQREFRSAGLGSGVIINQEGKNYYVLTNHHVVEDAEEVEILTYDEKKFTGRILGSDERTDLALVSFEKRGNSIIKPARLGNSDSLNIGDWVMAMGSPYGLQSSVTAGIVSYIGRGGGPGNNISDFIQTDAAINHGNSGGALVNMRGEVIGINTWITSNTGSNVGIGFAIPINNTKRPIDDFLSSGTVKYGWLGVSIRDLEALISRGFDAEMEKAILESMGVYEKNGAFVSAIFTGSPAEKGGILPGDFITHVDGNPVKGIEQLTYAIGMLKPSQNVTLSLIRNNNEMDIEVKIVERASEEEVSKNPKQWPGMFVFPLFPDILTEIGLPEDQKGVFVASVDSKTKVQKAGVQKGDVITKINGQDVNGFSDFYRLLNTSEKKINFTYLREGDTFESPSIIR